MLPLFVTVLLASAVLAADCTVAVVGSPYSTCWDIATAAGISVELMQQYNLPRIVDCGALQIGQRLCVSAGTLPNISPSPQPDGSCATHTVASGEWCALIATRYGITVGDIETFNVNTYKWKGCAALQANAVICVSSGTPPPIPINDKLQCGPESPGNKTCPLKACCSAFGFCGLTAEYCEPAPNGDPCISNCGQPTLSTCNGAQLQRKIGYYAGWADRRPCQRFGPSNLDLTGFTGVVFAFATISQSLEIELGSADQPLLRELVGMKVLYPNLHVTIAVGGWAFSNNDPTKSLFSQMIETSENRANFINSVRSFLTDYHLDGIDIDMEYPAAMERNAPAEDTPNLTAFFREIRQVLGGSTISVAAPAGYWFLRGFEIDKIVEHVTYINMMSYDYHGPWDISVIGEDGTAKPHTSYLDIMNSVRLYTRAGVDLHKVNLGLGWYGRTYAVGSCLGMGCPMTGGGAPGECGGESGIKSQLEIWNDNITPTYDSRSKTFWYNKDGDFITYDDTQSWDYKTNVAGTYCFGGTFVWSLDQVRPSPPQEIPSVDVECHDSMTTEVLADCRALVNGISDTFNLNSTQCPGVIGVKSACQGGCCLYLSMAKFQNVDVQAREIKYTAQQILDACHSGSSQRRDVQLEKRVLPALLAITALWSKIVIAQIALVLIGALAQVLAAIFKEVLNDDEERGRFVLEAVQQHRAQYPEFNVIVVHSSHEYNFEEPWFYHHVEFDRPDPLTTYGYEIYMARKGTFLLKGDGGYINWAWSGYITTAADNPKSLTLFPPGISHGIAGPVKGRYTEGGQQKTVDLVVGLGNQTACATCFL